MKTFLGLSLSLLLVACGDTSSNTAPLDPLVLPNENAPMIAMGGDAVESACVLSKDGKLLCFGNNSANQLGKAQADYDAHPTPEAPSGLASAKHIDFGVFHACAALLDGQVSCWGGDYVAGMMGDGTGQLKIPPTLLPALSNVEEVELGAYFGCARHQDGGVSCWGDNRQAQLGLDMADDIPHDGAAPVPLLTGVSALALGAQHACALVPASTSEGGAAIFCWGESAQVQLGPFELGKASTPIVPFEGPYPVEISAGGAFGCTRTNEGKVYCWGRNAIGQLGNGSQQDSAELVLVPLEEPAISIAAGANHACAATERGHVFCWGQGSEGQLGSTMLDTCSNQDVVYGCVKKPLRVDISRAFRVYAGGSSTCAAVESGALLCWGRVGEARGSCKGMECAKPFELETIP